MTEHQKLAKQRMAGLLTELTNLQRAMAGRNPLLPQTIRDRLHEAETALRAAIEDMDYIR